MTNTERELDYLAQLVQRVRNESPFESSPVLWQLNALRSMRRQLDTIEYVAVRELRADETAWATIGSALGVSRQAAHERHRWTEDGPDLRPLVP